LIACRMEQVVWNLARYAKVLFRTKPLPVFQVESLRLPGSVELQQPPACFLKMVSTANGDARKELQKN